MTTSVFVSFDHDDQEQVASFRALNINPNHLLSYIDRSLDKPVVGPAGKPLTVLPSDKGSKPIRDKIITKFDESSRFLVLIGKNTHKSKWVKWEIENFFERKKLDFGTDAKQLVRGMRLNGCEDATEPRALEGRSISTLNWNPDRLHKWLDYNIKLENRKR